MIIINFATTTTTEYQIQPLTVPFPESTTILQARKTLEERFPDKLPDGFSLFRNGYLMHDCDSLRDFKFKDDDIITIGIPYGRTEFRTCKTDLPGFFGSRFIVSQVHFVFPATNLSRSVFGACGKYLTNFAEKPEFFLFLESSISCFTG